MRLPLPWSNYESTRLGRTEQRTVNMYPHATRGHRQFPGLSTFATVSVSAPSYDQTGSMANNESYIGFDDDGDRFYQLLTSSDIIYETALGTAEDTTTAGATTSYTFNYTGAPNPSSFAWLPTGSGMMVGDSNNTTVYQMSATSYQISTLAYASKSLSVSGILQNVLGIGFLSQGSKMILLGSLGGEWHVKQWSLPTPYDLDGATYDNKSFTFTTGLSPRMWVHPNGGRFWIVSGDADDCQQYNMVDPEDVSSAYLATTFDASAQDNQFSGGLAFGPSGDKCFLADFSNIYEYDTANFTWGGSVDGRGALKMDGVYYAVLDNTLYSIDSGGTTTAIGDIAGTGRVVMETDGVQLVITTGTSGNTIYVYTTAAGLVTVTDAAIEDDAKSSAYLDLAFYFDQDDGNFISSSNNDATTFSTDDKAEAESFADNVLRVYAHNQLLYLFGETSTEAWYTSGVGRPPVERQQVIERGIIGTHAIDSIDDIVYFVDQERRLNALSGLEYSPLYSPAVAEAWDGYTKFDDCIVEAYSYRQQSFVDVIFPTAGKSWTYHADSGAWCEREDTDNSRYRSVAYTECYNTLLILDHRNGKVYQFAEGTYQDDSSSITRTKDTGLVTSETYGDSSIAGMDMICNSLKITTDCTTDSSTLTVSLSKDGKAFGQSRTLTVNSGVNTRELNRWGMFREGVFRITTTANAGIDLVDVSADLEIIDV